MDVHHRSCTVCGTAFTVPRTPGRPAEKCSERCRVIAQRQHRRNYILRHFADIAAAS